MYKHFNYTKGGVLIVDKDVKLLSGMRDILQTVGHKVITATNGEEALKTLENLADDDLPYVIVTAVSLPVMSGLDLLEGIRKRTEWDKISFVVLTGKGEKNDIHRGIKLSVSDYIVKPFDADELLVAVENQFRRQA